MHDMCLASGSPQAMLDQCGLTHPRIADYHDAAPSRQQRLKSLDLNCAAGERPRQIKLGHSGPPKKPLLRNPNPQVRIHNVINAAAGPRSMSLPAGCCLAYLQNSNPNRAKFQGRRRYIDDTNQRAHAGLHIQRIRPAPGADSLQAPRPSSLCEAALIVGRRKLERGRRWDGGWPSLISRPSSTPDQGAKMAK